MYRYRYPCSLNMMPQIINRNDLSMVTSQSLGNMDQMFSMVEDLGESTGQGNSRTFFVSRKVHIIPATYGRVLSS
ncbi:hypothetical protein TNCV_2488841 [Trichonephila clavipes]|nr:hypothetical protein TNCV_2488841 [Trichonephila clavipes]